MELSLPHESARTLKGPLGYSAAFHLILGGVIVFGGIFAPHIEEWGGAGGQGTVNVNLVGNIPALPMPKPDIETTNRTVDTTKGLYQAEPQPVKPPDNSNAIFLPKFDRDKKPEYITKLAKPLPNPVTPPPNAIPYGNGGAPQIPTSSFRVTQDTKGGMGVTGTSGGSFGSQFPWYVEAIQRRISSNWIESTIDPTISFAPRCTVSFQILHDGSIANIQITQSSGNQSVDMSAIRAVQSSNPLDQLPPAYSGKYVDVEFWFEFHRQ